MQLAGAWQVVVDLSEALAWPLAAVAIAVIAVGFLRDPNRGNSRVSEMRAEIKGWAVHVKYHIDQIAPVAETEQPRQLGRPTVDEIIDLE